MIDLTNEELLEKLADLVAARVADKLREDSSRELVSRRELAKLAGLGIRTIDRMANGGSWERDASTGSKVWKPTEVRLEPIKQGGRVLFDKSSALASIKAGNA